MTQAGRPGVAIEPQTALLTERQPETADSLRERESARTSDGALAGRQLQPALPRTDSTLLQSAIGNRATQRLLTSTVLQPKLTIGAPDEAYEKEADAVAEEVVSAQTVIAASGTGSDGAGSEDSGNHQGGSSGTGSHQKMVRQMLLRRTPIRTLQQTLGNRTLARLLQGTLSAKDLLPAPAIPEVRRQCACGGAVGQAEEECADCRKNRVALQRQATGGDAGSEAPSVVEEVFRTPGQPLADSARKTLEPGFGHDFSQVRIHDDSKAAESASAVSALAYTVGNHVVFGAGQYAPGTQNGNRLLAHELTHTIQQTGGVALADRLVEPGSAAQLQAEAAAPAMVAARGVRVSAPSAVVARVLESNLPRPHIDFPPGLLAACPTLAEWRQLNVDADLRSLVEAYKAVDTAKAASDTANAAVDPKDGTKPSQAASDAAQKAATDYIGASTELSQQCGSLASKLLQPKLNLNPAAPTPSGPPPQPADLGLGNTPPPQPQPGLTTDALAAKLADELTALANQQGSVISGAVRSGRHAKQVAATFLAHYRETLPFAWSTVQDATDNAIHNWFLYYEVNLPKDKSKPRNTGDDAIVFFNGSDVRYGDVLDTFISEANKAGFSFDRDHVWEVTADFLDRMQQLQDRLTGGGTETKPDEKSKKLAAPNVALQSQLNFTGHRTLVKNASNTQDPPSWQVTGAVTVPLHPDKEGGFEVTAQAAVSFVMTQDGKIVDGTLKLSDPKATLTNAQEAVQVAWVQELIEDTLQFQAFAQLVGGASWVQDSTNVTSGTVTLKPAGMVQVVGGMQLVFEVGKHVQLFIQLQTSVTGTAGQPSTLDLQGAGGVQIQFNIF